MRVAPLGEVDEEDGGTGVELGGGVGFVEGDWKLGEGIEEDGAT